MKTFIQVTDTFGRGVYARETIEAGEIITACELLVFSPDDTLILEETDLKFYKFKFNSQQDCLCLGIGELFNHSDQANVAYDLEPHEGRHVMVFSALTRIEAGAQLFINYAADEAVNPAEYRSNMVG